MSANRPTRTPTQRPTREEAEAAVETLIRWAGEDPSREGLQDTPKRVAKAYEEVFGGYEVDALSVLDRTFGETGGYDDLVLVRAIPFVSHCEHHLAPIIGRADIAYRPDGRIVGLSKLARLVDALSRRMQTQERLTREIADALQETLRPKGIGVVLTAEHLCMSMRGIRAHGAETVTSTFLGTLAEDAHERARVFAMAQMERRR